LEAGRKRMKKLVEDAGELDGNILRFTTEIAAKKESLEQYKASADTPGRKARLQKANADLKIYRGEFDKSAKKISELREKLAALETKEKVEQEASDLAERAYLDAKQTIESKDRAVERDEAVVNAEVAGLRRTLAGIKKQAGGKCPTCRQDVTTASVDRVEREIDGAINKLSTKAAGLAKQRDALKKELENLKEPQPMIAAKMAADVVREAMQPESKRLETMRSRVRETETTIATLQGEEDKSATLVKKLEGELEELSDNLAAEEGARVELTHMIQDLEIMVDTFGTQGLRSFLIEAETPEINKWATLYSQGLFGEKVRLRLCATTDLKSKKGVTREKLSIECFLPGKTDAYTGASTGQKRRLLLSLILAFRRVVAGRSAKAFNLFLADELFDGMDRVGAAKVCALLRDIAESCPVALVTHDPRIKPVADRLAVVHHDGKRAVIEGSNATAPVRPVIKTAKKKVPAAQ
jgi:hypothetical protein